MSLLWRIADDAVDPGYASAAARADATQPSDSGLGHSLLLAGALVVLGALISAAVVQTQQGAPTAERTRADLVERVVTATAQNDALAARVDDLTAKTADSRSAALSGTEADQRLSEQVDRLESAVGLEPVTGPGVEIVLTDGPPTDLDEGEPDLARVLDGDLQLAVNGLFAAGAEAVSVNGQRLTTLSAIRGAGGAVLVGYRPLSPPYTLSAIGDPATLEQNFENSAAASQLRTLADSYGIGFEVESKDGLTLPGKPDLTLRYASTGGKS